ncbi:cytochrome c biogenesis protein ResB [Paenibacillus sp. Soil522]|uniref:cytochrome c biogenesis protein ResB n=1 Tax=Paenibacillus sp. Soil522 TaxID=1736388 RepID=UPI000700ADB8|nr:cytochrome c biogenesis protein ResB [Paenibacillus sp. Soil522]KRE46157.1 cytochrome C biogenesis protein [Paenibacillus sp. Soil522]
MERVNCECGHVNPHGTHLCESCGKQVGEDLSEKSVDMRYEGSARRSQTYNKTPLDKVWNFFSSVKVGIWIIVLLLIASAIGTIFPQQMYIPPNEVPEQFYREKYGFFGQIYYQLGFNRLYESWWYFLLLAALGISLVIASLDRVIPLYFALKNQGVTRHESFIRRQRLFSETRVKENSDEQLDLVITKLKNKRYRIREENGDFLAEKNRFSRWGPYVNHAGLIIFLIGGMLRFVPGMYVDEMLWIRDGETSVIPGTNGKYYLNSDKFILETYQKDQEDEVFANALSRVGDGNVIKNYQTNVTLYERKGEILYGDTPELVKVKDEQIKVNHPLKHDSLALYQVSYKLNELNKMTFRLVDKKTEKSFGQIKIDLLNPQKEYDLGNEYIVKILEYFPNFYFDSESRPATRSQVPNNPAFYFNMISPGNLNGEKSFVAIRNTMEPSGDNQLQMKFESVEMKNLSALTVRKDHTLWFLGLGGAIFMIGVIQGLYWNHRRIWIRRSSDAILIAGHTNKNWYGIQTEINHILKETGLQELTDQTNRKSETS